MGVLVDEHGISYGPIDYDKGAVYRTVDFPDGTRLHMWHSDSIGTRFAVGHGPIEEVTREEAMAMFDRAKRKD